MAAVSYFNDLPRELNSKIFSYLPLTTIISRFAKSSKSAASLVQAVLSDGVAAPNSLNILVTGLPGAGSTTLYSRLKADLDIFSRIRNLNDSQETSPSPLKLVDDNWYQICGIHLQNTRASIWHGSTKQNQSAMMYAHCGACQAILYVIPCGDIEQVKTKLRQDLITYHALTSNVEWIFVINKMDLVQYNEQEFNKCISSIKKVAVKVIGEHRMDRLHFIPMSASDMSTPVTGGISDTKMTWHNKDVNLWSVLNRVSDEREGPAFTRLFKKLNASIIQNYTKLSTTTVCVIGVYIIDGCVSVGDYIRIYPTGITKVDPYESRYFGFQDPARVPDKVVAIQSNHTSRPMALPNSYVTLGLTAQRWKLIKKYHFVQLPPTPSPHTNQYSRSSPEIYFHAVILHVADVLPEYKWGGMLNEGYAGAIHSIGTRANISIHKILKVWDKNGNQLDLKQIQEERKTLGIRKGEKAEVLLQRVYPCVNAYLTKRNNANDVCGRFVILNQKSHVVAVGSINRGFTHLEMQAAETEKGFN